MCRYSLVLPLSAIAFERRCRGCNRRGLGDEHFNLIGAGDRLERFCIECRRRIRVDREFAARTAPAKRAAMAASAARLAVSLAGVTCQLCPLPARHRHHASGYELAAQTVVVALCPRCHGAAHRSANRPQNFGAMS